MEFLSQTWIWIVGFFTAASLALLGWWETFARGRQIKTEQKVNQDLHKKYMEMRGRNARLVAEAQEAKQLRKLITEKTKDVLQKVKKSDLAEYINNRNRSEPSKSGDTPTKT